MNTQRLIASLLITGFAIWILSLPFSLPEIYQTSDPFARVKIIEEHETQWKISQSLFTLGFLVLAAGFTVFALRLRTMGNAWIPALGGAALVLGTISGLLFIYRQTTDTLRAYQGAYSGFENIAYWLILAGLLLFGVAILQSGLPAWLGYLASGAAIVYSLVFLLMGTGFVTPGIEGILGLLIGFVLLYPYP